MARLFILTGDGRFVPVAESTACRRFVGRVLRPEVMPSDDDGKICQFESREMTIIRMRCAGQSFEMIAEWLDLSPGYIKAILIEMYDRLGVQPGPTAALTACYLLGKHDVDRDQTEVHASEQCTGVCSD